LQALLRIGVTTYHQQTLNDTAHEIVVSLYHQASLIADRFVRTVRIADLADQGLLVRLQTLG
jgi:hypothetical protein